MGDGAPISQEIKLPTDSSELGKAVGKLDQLIAKLGKSGQAATEHGHKVETAAQKIRGEFGHVGHAAEYAKTELKDLLEFTGILAGIELMKKLAESVVDIGKEAVTAAAAAERMNRVIDSASGGKAQGKENREWLAELSKKTEFSEAQVEGSFVDLKRVGASDQQAKLAMKAAADIAAVSKNKDEAFSATVEAFARLERTGKISNRTLAPLGLGEKDFAQLPQFKGMNAKQIKAGVEKGQVSKNDLYALIMSRTGEKAIGEKAAANADLLGTKLSKLSELPEKFYKKLAEDGKLAPLTKALDKILSDLDPDSPKGKKISEFFDKAFTEGAHLAEELGTAIEGIDFDSLSDTITEDVIPALKTMIGLINPALKAVETTVRGLSVAASFIGGRAAPGKQQEKAVDAYQKNIQVADDPNAGFFSKLAAAARSPFLRIHAGIPQQGVKEGEAITDGVTEGIKAGTPAVESAAAQMGTDAHDAFMSPDGIHAQSPSKKFKYGGQMMAEGVAVGFESRSDRIADAMTSMTGPQFSAGGSTSTTARGAVHLSIAEGAVSIHVSGAGDKSEIAGMVRDEIGRSLAPMLIDALESAQDGR